ncbi:hypothetical protein NMN56_029160 [Streptomyces iconiensis]|uniref:Protein kinase domain-containing protein n=1 Tax=Streptomyces iconiensis TaxID=1384038 RepID=A0ABT7A3P9_9ACTN|nr:hypothetical protein [Streptomyces iconiensis]MDJ1135944.1 hypothetical protein [Streptomyces iconiensis]
MEDYAGYAGRLLADRYRLPRPPSEEYELAETTAWDTASGQEVLVRQVPLPEVVEAEVVGDDHRQGDVGAGGVRGSLGRATRRPADPVVRRAVDAALAASHVPDHPRLDQVFDVFVEGDGLWIVSELVPARPLAALLAERPLGAHRAAEIGADLLAALRIVHAHGWAHRNVTARTVLICEDGRALLTGLAVGAAEEALCGYDPLPEPGSAQPQPLGGVRAPGAPGPGPHGDLGPDEGQAPGYGADPRATGADSGSGSGADRGPGSGRAGSGEPGAAFAARREARGGPVAQGPGAHGPYTQVQQTQVPRGPATFTGQPLPEGFDPRHDGPREVHPSDEGPREDGSRADGAGWGGPPVRGVPGRRPAGGDARSRGIFGFEGVDPDEGENERGRPGQGPGAGPGPGPHSLPSQGRGGRPGPGGPQAPVAHGYGTTGAPGVTGRIGGAGAAGGAEGASGDASARAARRGAIAAYRAGTQRAAAESRDSERRSADEGTNGPAADWWATAPGGDQGQHGADGRGPGRALDDDVRWLPSDEDEVLPDAVDGGVRGIGRDEVYGPGAAGPYGQLPAGSAPGPTALPGARGSNRRSIPAAWSTGAAADDRAPENRPPGNDQPTGSDRPAGDGRGSGDAGLRIFEAPAEDPQERAHPWDEPYDSYEPYEAAEGYDAPDEPGDGAGQWAGHAGHGATGGHERPWGGEAYEGRYRGPTTALAAERARHTRMTVVGPVTERWAPEQAGPVYENWRLAPPVGPAADLWALGALLFRSVQGHAPYPEDSAAELVQMVCAEPPAFAEDCGPLRPVVESLMRQDPTERPDFEELRGWLRSLIRSAPEPEVGLRTVTAPPSLEPGEPADPRRLPIVRRRGELVRSRRRRRQKRPAVPERPQYGSAAEHEPHHEPAGPHKRARAGSPRRLGRLVVGLVLLGMAAAVMYAMWFMPKQGEGQGAQKGSVVVPDEPGASGEGRDGEGREDKGSRDEAEDPGGEGKGKGDGTSSSGTGPRESKPAEAPKGYKTSRDPEGFQVAVPEAWDRRSANGRGQVRYNGGEVEMVVVKGRDSTKKYGKDPMTYQSEDEPELAAYRASDWAGTGGLRRIDVGDTAMAEGTFKWKDGGRQVYARNRALILDGRYHVLLVVGSEARKSEVDQHFESVADTYRVTRG